jgi:DNA-binding CsgD family transcriptional regulator
VWHIAQSLDGPDEQVAGELERSAASAQARGGSAGAAAFLSKSALLTPDSGTRARRELEAAVARFQSGDGHGALELLSSAEARGLDDQLLAHAQLLRGQIELYLTHGGDAPALLLAAARALKPFDPSLARETYLEAVQAAGFAGRFNSGETLGSIARAALAEAPAADPVRPVDLLLDALARFYADGAAAATSAARIANEALLAESAPSPETVRWMWIGANLAFETFDDELIVPLAERGVALARESGTVLMFVIAAWMLGGTKVLGGDLAGGNALFRESIAIAEDTGAPAARFALLAVQAWRGESKDYDEFAASIKVEAENLNEGHVLTFVEGISAVLCNGTGEYRRALDHCKQMLASDRPIYGLVIAFEYAEAASRAGTEGEIGAARECLAVLTSAAQTRWARGLRAISRALLDGTADAEACYRESIDEFDKTTLLPYLGRAHLLFGEWLRREGRRREGRSHLRVALDLLSPNGYEAFAARAARELVLAGDTSRRRPPTIDDELTPQELQIAQMAASGLSNRQIAERMYLSHRTVASHLYRVYPKLGITSRSQLHLVLPSSGARPPVAAS